MQKTVTIVEHTTGVHFEDSAGGAKTSSRELIIIISNLYVCAFRWCVDETVVRNCMEKKGLK